ncbi:MAG: S-layer homology domain-containing protein [Candidatus Eremiobacteraeota bacterium]|nr:S-layer homology domain-containing protein [Candidatus Eremiobacteraeota bacterium]
MHGYRVALLALLAACVSTTACTHSQTTTNGAAASASPAASMAEGTASPTASGGTPVAYTDIGGVFGEKQITDLAALGVFGTPRGSFDPNGTITRADFIKWLVQANNAIWANVPEKMIRPSQGATSAYPDVATSHPDFAYIQGVYDAGFAIGFPDKTFRPDANLTREQMIAIKESVDRGGVDKYYVSFWDSTMPDWKDKQQVNKQFRGAIAEDAGLDHYAMAQRMPVLVIGNVPRSFGAIAMLRPQQPVTRAEAASILWKIGAHNDKVLNAQPSDAPRSAADALAPPTPTPTP